MRYTAAVEIQFDIAVIGAGMMGSAAARHLSQAGAKVAAIGPSEPLTPSGYGGPFASHYDEARITRRLDKDADWSLLSARSIARYRALEEATGVRFFYEQGAVMAVSPRFAADGVIGGVQSVDANAGIRASVYDGLSLRDVFPYLAFPDDTWIAHETLAAGYINPRAHVRAQIRGAKMCGAVRIEKAVLRVEERAGFSRVFVSDGSVIDAGQVVLACGAYTRAGNLVGASIPQRVFARTVAFVEVRGAERDRLRNMPSIVYYPPDTDRDVYVLPPVTYPDGRTYLKIGGDPFDIELKTSDEISAWFRQGGNVEVGLAQRDSLFQLVPGLRATSFHVATCVVTRTSTGYPFIYRASDGVVIVTGGNGAGAKNADEVGRLAAKLTLGGSLSSEGYATSFAPPGGRGAEAN